MIRLLFISILILSISACKSKKVDSPNFYFSFDIGSKHYELDSATVAFSTQGDSISAFQILAFSRDYKLKLNSFGRNSVDASFIGTYLTIESPQTNKILIAGGFIDNDMSDVNYGSYPIIYDGKYTFTISEKNAASVSGYFSGVLTSSSNSIVNISNGKFKISL